jgi:tetratricopeptide (TPR) repeat protein
VNCQTYFSWVYASAVTARLPEKAHRVFDEILSRDPRHPQALYGKAMLLVAAGDEPAAIALFDLAIAAAPHFVEPRRYRAILLARQGRFELAGQDINWCLEKEPDNGANHYAAACVAALTVPSSTDSGAARAATSQALTFLENAYQRNYGRDKAPDDPDLASVRAHPAFQKMLD